MMAKSKIEWTEMTWNPVIGCTKCSQGCENCYAEKMACRINQMAAAKGNNDLWADYSSILKFENNKPIGWNNTVCLQYHRLDEPLHWRQPRKIFVCSMSDLFHEKVPFEFTGKVFKTICKCQQHIFQVLTKRPKRLFDFYKTYGGTKYLEDALHKTGQETFIPNLWLGLSVSTQKEADEKLPILMQIPAAVRFVSIEPMLENINFNRKERLNNGLPIGTYLLDWIIVGAESKGRAAGRLCKPGWIDSIVNQCKAADVPCFVKQIYRDGMLVKMPPDYPQEKPK